jgi:hypothetical protein
MIEYWLLFLIPAYSALSEQPVRGTRLKSFVPRKFFIFGIVLALMIGLRYKVGGDWNNYFSQFQYTIYGTLADAVKDNDPAFGFLNWAVAYAGLDLWAVNLVCGVLFSWGLLRFALRQPRPWLAACVAVPYLIIVVAMGYTRQGVAIGLAMLGFAKLSSGSTVRFVICIAVAAAFHKTALVLIPLAALATTENRVLNFVWVGVFGLALYYLLVLEDVDRMLESYITAGYQSDGAWVRIAMTALPSAVFLMIRQHTQLPAAELRLWTYIALAALAAPLALMVSSSSTAVDRLALYMIPLQLVVLSRLPEALDSKIFPSQFLVVTVIFYSATVMYVWFNFSHYSDTWIPYRLFPIGSDLDDHVRYPSE